MLLFRTGIDFLDAKMHGQQEQEIDRVVKEDIVPQTSGRKSPSIDHESIQGIFELMREVWIRPSVVCAYHGSSDSDFGDA